MTVLLGTAGQVVVIWLFSALTFCSHMIRLCMARNGNLLLPLDGRDTGHPSLHLNIRAMMPCRGYDPAAHSRSCALDPLHRNLDDLESREDTRGADVRSAACSLTPMHSHANSDPLRERVHRGSCRATDTPHAPLRRSPGEVSHQHIYTSRVRCSMLHNCIWSFSIPVFAQKPAHIITRLPPRPSIATRARDRRRLIRMEAECVQQRPVGQP